MVKPGGVSLPEEEMDFGEESLLDDSPLDNLDEHFADLAQAGKAEGGKNKRALNEEDVKELRSTQMVSRRMTCEKVVKFDDFDFLMVIGRGAFGKVFLAQLKGEEKLYAVKSLRKDILIQYDQVDSTVLEKNIMLECDHVFLCGMDYLYQNDMRLYFVMPFVRGAELYKVFCK